MSWSATDNITACRAKVLNLTTSVGGLSAEIIFIETRIDNPSSNPGWGYLPFTSSSWER